MTDCWEERRLWCEVIERAWDDLLSDCPDKQDRKAVLIWERAKREASLFLTKSNGDWAASRADICLAAGIDPDALRDRALLAMKGHSHG